MDKFGIFKLLNSFLNFYGQSKGNDSQQKSNENINFSDLLKGLNLGNSATNPTANGKDNGGQQNANQKPAVNSTRERNAPPLQSSMLYTLNSHDQFVKRVKEKNTHLTQ